MSDTVFILTIIACAIIGVALAELYLRYDERKRKGRKK